MSDQELSELAHLAHKMWRAATEDGDDQLRNAAALIASVTGNEVDRRLNDERARV